MDALLGLQIQRVRGIRVQVEDYVRDLITSGRLKEETRLPPTEELAGLWGVGTMTIQKALTPLVKEGLLIRRPKSGTFVRKREERLTCVAVLDGVAVHDSPYKMAVHQALQEELQQAGIEMDLWLDPRPAEQLGEPWRPFLHAAAHREFQAVIVTGTSTLHLPWHTKLPVPTAFAAGPDLSNSVTWDIEQFAELSVQILAQQGCRSVGLIFPAVAASPGGARHRYTGFYEHLMDRVGELGLTLKNEWVRTPPAQLTTPTPGNVTVTPEQFGHKEFLRLWELPERPEGLIVYPDMVARGVILGLLDKQVQTPEELKLVLHKNEAVDLYCPLSATFVVSSERKLAQALIAQVQKQFHGTSCAQIRVGFTRSSTAPEGQP